MKGLKRGKETTSRQLITDMGDAVLGIIITPGIPYPGVVVQIVGDSLRVVSLEDDRPVATNYLDLPPDESFEIVANPQEAIKQFQSRFHQICKAYGLRH